VTNLGPKPRIEFHSPDKLIIDARYQRSISRTAGKKLIATIVNEFYWPFFGVLSATDNGDGTYCLIDGQHRAEAARQHPNVHSVPVMVIDEMTLSEQAKAFVTMNKNRVRLSALQIHKAAVLAGDRDAVTINEITKKFGIKILTGNKSSVNMKPGQTLAVRSLYSILKKYGPPGLNRTIKTVMMAYGETIGDLRSFIFTATAQAVNSHPDHTDQIAEVLANDDAVSWQEKAKVKAKFNGTNARNQLAIMLTKKI